MAAQETPPTTEGTENPGSSQTAPESDNRRSGRGSRQQGQHLKGQPGRQRLWPSLVVLIALTFTGALAPILSPHSPSAQIDVGASQNQPPGSSLWLLRIADPKQPDGKALLAETVRYDGQRIEVERRGVSTSYSAEQVLNLDPETGRVQDRLFFLLGTDALGRDILSRVIYGARVSLWVAAGAASLALLLGILVGGLAGTGGPIVDSLAMRITDAFLSFPWLFVILALSAFLKPSIGTVVVIIAAGGWMETARLLRSEILSLKNRDFILAAHGAGLHPVTVFLRHLLPNALTPVMVQGALFLGRAILAESALSFLGYGVQPPTPSWGNMIDGGRSNMASHWWISTFPGLALVIVVMALNRLGDALRDRLDPKAARTP